MSFSSAMLSRGSRVFAGRTASRLCSTSSRSTSSVLSKRQSPLYSITPSHAATILPLSRSFATNTQSTMSSQSHPASYVVTTAGPDRPGIVHTIASHLSSLGANIEESRMTVLGGDFAVILRITTPPAINVDTITSSLSSLFPSFLVAARPTSAAPPTPPPSPSHILTISIEGPDQPGVVAAFTHALTAAHPSLSIRDLDTDTSSAPFAGYRVFSLRCVVAVSGEVGRVGVRERLVEFEEKWGFDVVCEEDGMDEGGEEGEDGEGEGEDVDELDDDRGRSDDGRGRQPGRPQRR